MNEGKYVNPGTLMLRKTDVNKVLLKNICKIATNIKQAEKACDYPLADMLRIRLRAYVVIREQVIDLLPSFVNESQAFPLRASPSGGE